MCRDLEVERDGVRLAVRDHGGDGPALVLIHGLSSNLCIWEPVAKRLAGRWRVVAYDQRNHGRSSDADDFSFPALIADLEAVAAAVGLEDFVCIGHSWGASVALRHAGARPGQRAVVCVDGGVIDAQGMGFDRTSMFDLLRPPVLEGPAEELYARIRDEQLHLSWEHLEAVVRRSFPPGPDGFARRRLPIAKHMDIVGEMWAERIVDIYDAVDCPVMVVLADLFGSDHQEEGFVAIKRESVRRLHETHPGVRAEWIPSVHDIPLLHPAELVGLIEAFLTAAVPS